MEVSNKLAFSISDIVKLSGVGRTTIFSEIKVGHLKVRKCGRRTIALRADVEGWLSHLPSSTADRD
jgi:hypothetical protein